MKVLAVHADVLVATSRIWQTNCVLVRRGDEAFCIDSPILPDELELLPTVADQSGFPVMGRLCTHADWDHVLAGYAFPDTPLGCSEHSLPRFREVGHALRAFDEEHYVVRSGPLTLGGEPGALPVPGHLAMGDTELDVLDARGHTSDGMALWIPWARVLACGDYLSPVELPTLSPSGDLHAYLETLERLEPLLAQADHVVPGHGEVLSGEQAGRILAEDRQYLTELLEQGADTPLPGARATEAQRRIHARNVAFLEVAAALPAPAATEGGEGEPPAAGTSPAAPQVPDAFRAPSRPDTDPDGPSGPATPPPGRLSGLG